jgi:hypothetical protein
MMTVAATAGATNLLFYGSIYKIKTYDKEGKATYKLVMNLDLRLIRRKQENEISWIIKECLK